MKKEQLLRLCLFSTPFILISLIGSLTYSVPVEAMENNTVNLNVMNPNLTKLGNSPNLEKNEYGDYILNFTIEESNDAIALFGCDCASSLNKLKRLRGMTYGVYGELLTDDVFLARCPHSLIYG